MSVDPEFDLLQFISPYHFALNSPIQTIDAEGEFPILINGNTFGGDHERASSGYWSAAIISSISEILGYSAGKGTGDGSGTTLSQWSGDFMYVDGNRAKIANYNDPVGTYNLWGNAGFHRQQAGKMSAVSTAKDVWDKLKESVNEDGKITEKVQIITHSRGAHFGIGYVAQLKIELMKLAEKEGIGFAYDADEIIEFTVNLAPHQSNSLDYPDSKTENVNISHKGDVLSGDDATGDVTNLHTKGKEHSTGSFVREIRGILKYLVNKRK